MIVKKACKRALAFAAAFCLVVGLFASFTLLERTEAQANAIVYSDLVTKAVRFNYQAFISGTQLGAYDAYILTLSGADVSKWVYDNVSLKDSILNSVYETLQNPAPVSAKQIAHQFLAMSQWGYSDLAGQLAGILKEKQGADGSFNDGYGIYSDMPAYEALARAGKIGVVNTVYARNYILNTQCTTDEAAYGSWGSIWGPDFMSTAQAVRAQTWLQGSDSDQQIKTAIAHGLAWMRNQQQVDGSVYVTAPWPDDPLIDTAETIHTLKTVGVDPLTWKSYQGTPVDYMVYGAPNDDGSFGALRNVTDATWALHVYLLLGGAIPTPSAPVGLSVIPATATVTAGGTQQYQAVIKYFNGTESNVTADAAWEAADSAVASVSNGLATGLGIGRTTVSATYGGLTGTATLIVTAGGGSDSVVTDQAPVSIAVVGKNGELLFGPASVQVKKDSKWGITALGALDATGLPYTTSDIWPGFVTCIAGQPNEGTQGWMYKVNNETPATPANEKTVQGNDTVIWWYSKDMTAEGPTWNELLQRFSAGAVSPSEALTAVEEIQSALQDGKIEADQGIDKLSDLLGKLKEDQVTGELQSKLSQAVKMLAQKIAALPGKAVNVQIKEETVEAIIDGNAFKDQVNAVAKAAVLATKLAKSGVADAGMLTRDNVTVQLPHAATQRRGFAVTLPSDAAQAVVESTLNLVVKGGDISINLPPEAVKTVLQAADNVSSIKLSTQKVTPVHLPLLEGAAVIGGEVLDIDVTAVTPQGNKEKPKASFAKKMTVTISLEGLDMSKVNPAKLAVYRQKQGGSWEYLGGRLSPDGKEFSFETEHTSVYALMEYRKTFRDIKRHWAQKEIESMAIRLTVKGVGGDTFAPDQKVTRAQFAAFLIRVLGIEEQNPAKPIFRDVPPGYWGYKAIAAASSAGVVTGIGKGNFAPERKITREEMAAMVARALRRSAANTALTGTEKKERFAKFTDSQQVSAWAKDAVATCVDQGILGGRTETTNAPLGHVTRAEAVVALARLLKTTAGAV